MKSLINWFDRLPSFLHILIRALFIAVPFYFAAYLSYQVTEIAKLSDFSIYVHSATVIILLIIIISFSLYISSIRKELQRKLELKRSALLSAYTCIDRIKTKELESINQQSLRDETFIENFICSVDCLQRIVEGTYNTFESNFGSSSETADRIDFEVTFMTKSYQDGRITIPACANRDGRSPRSMVLRGSDPEIYEKTVTAQVYRETRPLMHIIEDTSAREYEELYPNQKHRIKSSIIFPVLNDKNELLGTLVVHCDKARFFRAEDEKYWTDMLEIFAKRLAVVKAKMDLLIELPAENKSQISFAIPNFEF